MSKIAALPSTAYKAVALMESSPLARFSQRFYRAAMWSWREFFVLHHFQDGVIKNEFEVDLEWALNRRLSCIHAFRDESDPKNAAALQSLIDHYGIERVSAAKDGLNRLTLFIV